MGIYDLELSAGKENCEGDKESEQAQGFYGGDRMSAGDSRPIKGGFLVKNYIPDAEIEGFMGFLSNNKKMKKMLDNPGKLW